MLLARLTCSPLWSRFSSFMCVKLASSVGNIQACGQNNFLPSCRFCKVVLGDEFGRSSTGLPSESSCLHPLQESDCESVVTFLLARRRLSSCLISSNGSDDVCTQARCRTRKTSIAAALSWRFTPLSSKRSIHPWEVFYQGTRNCRTAIQLSHWFFLILFWHQS